jgi:hypothetical protein
VCALFTRHKPLAAVDTATRECTQSDNGDMMVMVNAGLNPPANVPLQAGASVLASIDEQARVDPARPETAFVVGPNYYFKRDNGEFRYLVSLSVTTYQGLMYRVRTLSVLKSAN